MVWRTWLETSEVVQGELGWGLKGNVDTGAEVGQSPSNQRIHVCAKICELLCMFKLRRSICQGGSSGIVSPGDNETGSSD